MINSHCEQKEWDQSDTITLFPPCSPTQQCVGLGRDYLIYIFSIYLHAKQICRKKVFLDSRIQVIYTTISRPNITIKNNKKYEHLLNFLVFIMKDFQILKIIRKRNGIKILFLRDIYQLIHILKYHHLFKFLSVKYEKYCRSSQLKPKHGS